MDRVMYRSMKKDESGRPELGRSSRTLGVRVSAVGAIPEAGQAKFDVYPDADSYVAPGRGMSVAMDHPANLPKHRKPQSLGGESRDPLFGIHLGAIRNTLHVNIDRPPHALIEPATRCALAVYERALAATRSSWEEVAHV